MKNFVVQDVLEARQKKTIYTAFPSRLTSHNSLANAVKMSFLTGGSAVGIDTSLFAKEEKKKSKFNPKDP